MFFYLEILEFLRLFSIKGGGGNWWWLNKAKRFAKQQRSIVTKLACIYLFLFAASECDHSKVIFSLSYSSQLSTAADRCKNVTQCSKHKQRNIVQQ